jgi:DNA polymerase-3 subunit gamma/tau
MDKFVVSARKYRPQNFNTVVGQNHITTTLKNAIRNEQLAHAFLFCGPRGVGKTTCARILAKTINCLTPSPDGEACNTCNSCVSFNEGTSMNIHELDAASNNSVDDIRSLVEQVRFAPQAGKYKVYIVDEVHMLSASAFNAFLKTLEEPPSYAIFILATTEKHKILPTILSRCQIFDFKRITNNDTVEHLQEIVDKEHLKAEKGALQVIAQKSEGCLRDSLSILDKIVSFTNGEVTYQNTLEHLNILDHDYYFKLLDTQVQQDMAGGMLLFDEINKKGFEGDLVLNGFAEFIRNLLVCKNEKAAALLEVVEGTQSKYIETSKKINTAYLISALNILNEAEINYKMARNKRLHVELALIKLSFLQQAIDLAFDNQTSSLIKKKRINGPVAYKVEPLQSLQVVQNVAPRIATVSTAKLYIQPPAEAIKLAEAKPVAVAVEEPIVQRVAATNGAKKSLLQNLRAKHSAGMKEEEKECINIEEDCLQDAWKQYADQLKKQNKHTHVTVFNNAVLHVNNNTNFTVTVTTTIEQKFIEQEKMNLLEFLQMKFQNKKVGFNIEVVEVPKEHVNSEATLTTREKYLRIVEQYPLVKELKEKLKLELDY